MTLYSVHLNGNTANLLRPFPIPRNRQRKRYITDTNVHNLVCDANVKSDFTIYNIK